RQAVLTRHDHPDAALDEPFLAETAALLAATLG
ncbi:MAG: class A beta-lactamase, partial [Streptomycetaceae bacterium]|nr:class A beta-lactamase [Streptomycetaceae bacterium]